MHHCTLLKDELNASYCIYVLIAVKMSCNSTDDGLEAALQPTASIPGLLVLSGDQWVYDSLFA